MIINQDKLEFICEMILSNIDFKKTTLGDSDMLYHIRVLINDRNWYIPVYKADLKIMKISDPSSVGDLSIDKFEKSESIANLELKLKECIEYHNSMSDEEFIKTFPEYKERLRDYKIKQVTNDNKS